MKKTSYVNLLNVSKSYSEKVRNDDITLIIEDVRKLKEIKE